MLVLLGLECALLPRVNTWVEVLACGRTVVPAAVVKRLILAVLGANLLFKLVDAFLVLVGLSLVVGLLSMLGRRWALFG